MNKNGDLDDMSSNEHPIIKAKWKFQKEFFKELPYVTRTFSHYEAIVRKLHSNLYLDELRKINDFKLSAPLIKEKVKAAWEDWVDNNPNMGWAQYIAKLDHLYSKEFIEEKL